MGKTKNISCCRHNICGKVPRNHFHLKPQVIPSSLVVSVIKLYFGVVLVLSLKCVRFWSGVLIIVLQTSFRRVEIFGGNLTFEDWSWNTCSPRCLVDHFLAYVAVYTFKVWRQRCELGCRLAGVCDP